jgi:hypothetical protein
VEVRPASTVGGDEFPGSRIRGRFVIEPEWGNEPRVGYTFGRREMPATATQSQPGTGRAISVTKLPPVTSALPVFKLAALCLFVSGLTAFLLSEVNASVVAPAVALEQQVAAGKA